jgi:hypothetical protein
MPSPDDLTPQITAEIRRVLDRFGIGADLDLTDTSAVNHILESRGADIYLLCTIGSWKDTMSDQQVLQDLRDWLRHGEAALRPDPSFARVKTKE